MASLVMTGIAASVVVINDDGTVFLIVAFSNKINNWLLLLNCTLNIIPASWIRLSQLIGTPAETKMFPVADG